jgi:hypothetical protein
MTALNGILIPIMMSVHAPLLDSNCGQVGVRDDALIFTYMKKSTE